ncbi:hypothetical protein MYAM1_003860 [Malassezia yamatoensis]|uniref:Association with the SNF1 complex (ASC) domain-containing protein n=1 Tax=Malassezia yamatoensis TaxID=253288 RepID=A0AAJ6CJS4_9BASI|nr:hypothetical protein MYAM1_003860 [Malassezia yamatoensis]
MGNTSSIPEDSQKYAKRGEENSQEGKESFLPSTLTGFSNTHVHDGPNLAPIDSEPKVTVHRPGHLYSHSINLPTGAASSSNDDAPSYRRVLSQTNWDSSASQGPVLRGIPYMRGPSSDASYAHSEGSQRDSSTQASESSHLGSTSDSDAGSGDEDGRGVRKQLREQLREQLLNPRSERPIPTTGFKPIHGGGRVDPIKHRMLSTSLPNPASMPQETSSDSPVPIINTDTSYKEVESDIKTPTMPQKNQDQPSTPIVRQGSATAPQDATPVPPQRENFLSRTHMAHRASLIIDDDFVNLIEQRNESNSDDTQASDTEAPESKTNRDTSADAGNKRRLRTLPSYLRIPTSIPRAFAAPAQVPSNAEAQRPLSSPGVPTTTLDIINMPMYGETTIGSSDVTAAAPTSDPSANRPKLNRAQTVPSLTASPDVSLEKESKFTSTHDAHVTPTAEKVGRDDTQALVAKDYTPAQSATSEPLTAVNLMWRGKGRKVYVTGTFADEWRSKVALRQLRPNTPFLCTLYLPPGTHRLKFIVDDRWRISNELNTASDGEGTLVNYVEIPNPQERFSSVEPFPTSTRKDSELRPADDPRFADPAWASAMDDLRKQQRSVLEQRTGEWDELADDMPGADVAHWTSEVPVSVEVAQETEEALHEHQLEANAAGILPVPPQLPRQLEKVILNSSPAHAINNINTNAAVVDDNSVLPAPNHAVLHHLAASSIKNGVLAIGTVTRYKRKVRIVH